MLKIRRVHDDVLPVNREIIRQVQQILRDRFPQAPEEEITGIGEKLRNPFLQRFRTILLVAENLKRKVSGFAILLHEPEIGFCYLDWIALAGGKTGGGIGGLLYDRVRAEAAALDADGLFFECLPDIRDLCPYEADLKQNRARLRFYERYAARPIVDTAYETPVNPDDTCMPFLMYDGLERPPGLRRSFARKVVRAILERKYANYCPPGYVEKVVASFKDNPVRLRPLQYLKESGVSTVIDRRWLERVVLVVNDNHEVHHVHERGYVESPARVGAILKTLQEERLFCAVPPRAFPDKHITAVHAVELVSYLRRACEEMPEGKSLYPYVFPIRNKTRPPRDTSVLSGYYCIDTFTPINRNAFPAARRAVDCVLTAAQQLLDGRHTAYALVRPPGHHAERAAFGGFCYLNNNAIAADYLSSHGKVAILDIDFHHGNGQQDIFYRRNDVLTISIHGHPRFAYPFFSGFEDELGEGAGEGFNWNIPLPETVDGGVYRKALLKALRRIADFRPAFLVIALGLDTAKGDPTGCWRLLARDFEANGRMIGEMALPTLIVQEGGYRTRSIGVDALHFFRGLAAASIRAPIGAKEKIDHPQWRHELRSSDTLRIRDLVAATGFFSEAEVNVAAELAEERLARGDASGYYFILAEQHGRLAGYSCYGPIACTATGYDLYWIAVHPDFQHGGLGRRLIRETEQRIRGAGGQRVYAETSQRPLYHPTHRFYETNGYVREALLPDFYSPGDGKVIYCKRLEVA